MKNIVSVTLGSLVAVVISWVLVASLYTPESKAIGLVDPITVTCYSGGQIVYEGVTSSISYSVTNTYKIVDERGHKVLMPKSICFIDFGQNN